MNTVLGHPYRILTRFLFERAGIALSPDRQPLVEARLTPILNKFEFETVADLAESLESDPDPELREDVLECLLVQETSWFREPSVFVTFRNDLLPELLERKDSRRELRLWSAACATGQEPYSLAMILRDELPEPTDWHVRLLATDVSTRSVQRGRRGLYSNLEMNRGLPAPSLVKHFRRQGANWKLDDDIRESVEFCTLNLVEDWHFEEPFDLILLRNVLIYFSEDVKRAVLGRVHRSLARDGMLLLGGSEASVDIDASIFDRTMVGSTAVYRPRHTGDSP